MQRAQDEKAAAIKQQQEEEEAARKARRAKVRQSSHFLALAAGLPKQAYACVGG